MVGGLRCCGDGWGGEGVGGEVDGYGGHLGDEETYDANVRWGIA